MTDNTNFTNSHGLFKRNFGSCSDSTDYDRPEDYPNDPMYVTQTTITNGSGTETREYTEDGQRVATDGGTDTDEGDSSEALTQDERDDIVWVAHSKDSDWEAGPFHDHLKAIDNAHEYHNRTGEMTGTHHVPRSEVDDGDIK